VSRISDGAPVEERWYTYDPIGNVDMVIRKIAGDEDAQGRQWYRGTELYYVKNGCLWMSRSLRWQLDAGDQPINCEPLAAMEYRYNGGRQRYMVRTREPETLQPYDTTDGTWHDYDGDSIYGDMTLSYDQQSHTLDVFDTTSHEPGMAQYDHNLGELHHLHGNLIGTTERITDDNSIPMHRAVYTAFGELVYSDGTVGTRYGYAGDWGYQASDSADPLSELGWLHVGERYYDPSCGRFVQRDPIGIRGGLNVYVYVGNNPVVWVDPLGLSSLMHPQSVALLIEMGWSAKQIAAATGMTVAAAAAAIQKSKGQTRRGNIRIRDPIPGPRIPKPRPDRGDEKPPGDDPRRPPPRPGPQDPLPPPKNTEELIGRIMCIVMHLMR